MMAMLASRRRRVTDGEPLRLPPVRIGLNNGRVMQGAVASVENDVVTFDDREGRRTWVKAQDVSWVEISDYGNFDKPPEGYTEPTAEQLRAKANEMGVLLSSLEPLDAVHDVLTVLDEIRPALEHRPVVGIMVAIGPRKVHLEKGVLQIHRGALWPDRWTTSALLAAIESCF